MGVQERSYLADRPIDEPTFSPDVITKPMITLEIVDLQKQIAAITAERNEAQANHKRAVAKVEDMHAAALCRAEVAELIVAVETALVALTCVRIQEGCERSRHIICGVHEMLQAARLNQGAAGRLPAGKIASNAALQAYYKSCSDRELKVVQKFD